MLQATRPNKSPSAVYMGVHDITEIWTKTMHKLPTPTEVTPPPHNEQRTVNSTVKPRARHIANFGMIIWAPSQSSQNEVSSLLSTPTNAPSFKSIIYYLTEP